LPALIGRIGTEVKDSAVRLAVFSDVHGNLGALEAVLSGIKSEVGVERVIFAGDLCLVGPRPAECVDLLKGSVDGWIAGNTDRYVLFPGKLKKELSARHRKHARYLLELARWTAGALGQDRLELLEDSLRRFSITIEPSTSSDDALEIVHANPWDDLQVLYPSESRQLKLFGQIRQTDADLAHLLGESVFSNHAFGHIHVSGSRHVEGHNLFNISSVSMPGDGEERARYSLLSWSGQSGWSQEIRYVRYDPEAEAEAYRDRKPPGWQEAAEMYATEGKMAQKL